MAITAVSAALVGAAVLLQGNKVISKAAAVFYIGRRAVFYAEVGRVAVQLKY